MKPGDRVKLSQDGLGLFRIRQGVIPREKRGVVMPQRYRFLIDDGIVTVLWDGYKSTMTLHEKFLTVDSQGSPSPQPASKSEQRFTKKDV